MKLTLKGFQEESSEATTFIFVPDVLVVYKPGQHVSLMLPIVNSDERGKVRTFTLSSSPTEKGILTITTKRGPSSFKQTLFALHAGDVLEARGPSGLFVFQESETRPQVMIAGGIGITPFRSMLKYATDKKLSLSLTLLYSNKTPEEIVFGDELNNLVNQNHFFKVVYTITRPESARKQWQGRVGRIDEALIREHVEDLVQSIYYICGSYGFVQVMTELLAKLGVLQSNILFEKFPGYQ